VSPTGTPALGSLLPKTTCQTTHHARHSCSTLRRRANARRSSTRVPRPVRARHHRYRGSADDLTSINGVRPQVEHTFRHLQWPEDRAELRIRLPGKSNLARPNICRLIVFTVTWNLAALIIFVRQDHELGGPLGARSNWRSSSQIGQPPGGRSVSAAASRWPRVARPVGVLVASGGG
jgi:hypothetical protein